MKQLPGLDDSENRSVLDKYLGFIDRGKTRLKFTLVNPKLQIGEKKICK